MSLQLLQRAKELRGVCPASRDCSAEGRAESFRSRRDSGWCFRLGSGGARVQPLPLVRNVQALGQWLRTAPEAAALERSPRPARAAKGQFRVGRSGPRFVSVAPLPSRRRGWAGEDAASARARSALQLVCVREWEAAGLRLWPSRLTAPTPQLQS